MVVAGPTARRRARLRYIVILAALSRFEKSTTCPSISRLKAPPCGAELSPSSAHNKHSPKQSSSPFRPLPRWTATARLSPGCSFSYPDSLPAPRAQNFPLLDLPSVLCSTAVRLCALHQFEVELAGRECRGGNCCSRRCVQPLPAARPKGSSPPIFPTAAVRTELPQPKTVLHSNQLLPQHNIKCPEQNSLAKGFHRAWTKSSGLGPAKSALVWPHFEAVQVGSRPGMGKGAGQQKFQFRQL